MFSSRGQSAGYAQLTASLGVDAGQYTLSELVQIKANQDDDTRPRIVIGGDDAASVSTRGGTAGYAQLAASLGVEAGVYTLSELVQIKADQDQDENLSVRLARAEAALDAEREKTAMLERHLDDVRRMLPPPDAKPRRWWRW